jgi:hypothetical protein
MIEMHYNADGEDDEEQEVVVRHCIPTEADFVYVGCEMPGLLTGRPPTKGSVFVSHLARCLGEAGAKTDIRRVATQTIQAVSEELDNWQPGWELKNDELVPYFISMLTKDLCFSQKVKT